MRKVLAVGGMLIALATQFAVAAAPSSLRLEPWVYDPDGLGISDAEWVDGAGLPDDPGKSAGKGKGKAKGHAKNSTSFGLYLSKMGPTSANAASGASIDFNGKLTQLSFDVSDAGWCGAGAPRFNIYTADGSYYFLGCDAGEHSSVEGADGWTHVEFAPDASGVFQDAFPVGTSDPLTVDTEVVGIEIVFDEGTDVSDANGPNPGYTILDNISVNNTLIQRP